VIHISGDGDVIDNICIPKRICNVGTGAVIWREALTALYDVKTIVGSGASIWRGVDDFMEIVGSGAANANKSVPVRITVVGSGAIINIW